MSQGNLEAIREVYTSWARGDFSASRRLFDRDVTLVVDAEIPDAGTYVGSEGVREYMIGFLEPWEKLTMESESITEAGDRVLALVRQRGVGRSSTVPVELRYFHVWTFQASRVIRVEVFLHEHDALEALRN
jgi:ketosteroid isomerase-like protein